MWPSMGAATEPAAQASEAWGAAAPESRNESQSLTDPWGLRRDVVPDIVGGTTVRMYRAALVD